MDGVLVPKDVKSFVVLRLLNVAMGGQVFTRRVPGYEILSREETEGARVVSSGEMHLSQPERILIIVCGWRLVYVANGICTCIANWNTDLSRRAACRRQRRQTRTDVCSKHPASNHVGTFPYPFFNMAWRGRVKGKDGRN